MSKSGRVDSSTHLLDAFATYWRDSAANGDDVRHIRRKSQQVFLNRLPSRQVRYLRLAIIAFIVFVLFVAIQLSASLQAVVSSQSSLTLSTLRAWYSAKEDPAFTSSLCPSCENQTCTVGLYATSEDFEHVPLATRDGVRNPKATVAIKKRYLLHHLVLKAIFERTWMNDESTSAIFRNYFSAPDSLLSLSFEGLDLDKPTTYMYTRTGPGGKLHDIKKRVRNIRRQGETIQKFQDLVEHEGYFDGQPKSARQIIYIVIEDDSKIDESVKEYLDSMGQRETTSTPIPRYLAHTIAPAYLYFAHGPTRWLGVAQWNAAERAVEVLRDTFFRCVLAPKWVIITLTKVC